jgi:ankyrin repeat protein
MSIDIKVYLQALEDSDIQLVEDFLKKGADPNIRDQFDKPFLPNACGSRSNYELVKLLLHYKADPNIDDNAPILEYVSRSTDGVDSKISLMQGTLKRTKDSLKKKLLELKIAILKEVSEEFDNSEDEQTDKKNVSTPQSFILPSSSKRKIRFTSTDPYNLGSDNKFYRKIQESKKKEDRKVSTEFKNGDIMRTKNGVEILFDKIFTQKKRAFVIVKGPQGDSTYPLEEFNNLIKDGTFSFTGENRAGNTSSLKLETTEELEIKKLEKKLLEIKTKREEIAKKLLELNSNIENVYKKPPTEDKSYISTAVGNMATGITENLYKQLFESLQKGSTKMARTLVEGCQVISAT